jgi:DNA (cytosine-5)-methyltransferase 1
MPGKNYLSLCDGKKSNFIKNTRFWNFLLKLKPDLPSWTIAAQPGPWVGPFHWTNRRLRVPEIAAIQTFPKNYKFYGNRRSIQKQIGNAVPPLLGKAMINYLQASIL